MIEGPVPVPVVYPVPGREIGLSSAIEPAKVTVVFKRGAKASVAPDTAKRSDPTPAAPPLPVTVLEELVRTFSIKVMLPDPLIKMAPPSAAPKPPESTVAFVAPAPPRP